MTDIATEPGTASSGSPIALLYAARSLRGFGDGFAIIVLPAYMTALGYDAIAVGLVATASLLGTALLTLIVGWMAARHDLRVLMLVGANRKIMGDCTNGILTNVLGWGTTLIMTAAAAALIIFWGQ